MAPLDPTGLESVIDDIQDESNPQQGNVQMSSQMSYEEISNLTNAELGLGEHDEEAPGIAAEGMPHLPPQPLPIPTPKPPIPIPIPPIPIKKAVSGCYKGALGNFQVELRVDVDRGRTMKRISGDFYQTVGKTTTYFGSFTVDSPAITTSATRIVARGLGRFTFSAGAPVVQVTIPRVSAFLPQAPASLQFYTVTNAPGANYHCPFSTTRYRTVRIETDRVSDVTTPVFSSYNSGSLPSGGATRSISVVSAFGEAGIGMSPVPGGVVNIAGAGAGAKWSNAELHASMQTQFSLWADMAQWCVWELVAQNHDMGSGLYGIMFDQQGKQRQGCAVFHAGIGGTSAEQLRLQLYTYVHELGHCFNLMHSWQKSYASPPKANRPNALSWMNYPWYYPSGGASGFWNSFDFRFDDEELIHLRHGFRNDVIMGGNNFTVGASLGKEVMADAIEDESGLKFEISTHQKSFALGEPVVLQLALKANDMRGRRVHSWLHPNCGLVKVVVQKPSGEVKAYEPMIDHLVGERVAVLKPNEDIRDSAYIGYGKDGFYFDQPGQYRVRAAYAALDGSQVLSDLITIRVRYPVSAEEDRLAELFMGDDQGALLYLQGSDSEALRAGNEAFEEVLDRFDANPLATYVRMIKGVNLGRTFKTVGAGGQAAAAEGKPLGIREAKPQESIALLSNVTASRVLDPVTKDQALMTLSNVQKATGDDKGANATLSQLSVSSMVSSAARKP